MNPTGPRYVWERKTNRQNALAITLPLIAAQVLALLAVIA